MWENVPDPARDSADLHAFTRSRALGDAAAALQGAAVRYWRDEVLRKMPAGHAASAPTPWHQDHPYTPFDRTGRPQFWIALADVPPERGSLSFLSGSHRWGVLGRAFNDGSEAMKARIASVVGEYPQSPPLHLRPGDATVHDGMTIHSAGPNRTDEPRWAYVVQFFVADALYNGAQNPFSDDIGLEINQPFPDDRFPIVGWPPSTGDGG
jgi:ectoine hydroxylase-related dioxygenase (phytanoyl-CoA dioxygenase family)